MNHCSHWTRFYGAPGIPRLRALRRGFALRLPRGERGDDLRRRIVVHGVLRLTRRRREDGSPGTLRAERSAHMGADRALLETRRRHLSRAAGRISSGTGSRPSAGTGSASRRRGEPPTRSRSCSAFPNSRIEPVHQFMTLRQLAQDFFESPELQILFMRAEHDIDRLLRRRRPWAPGTDPLHPADALVRARRDRGRRQPGDHRRARRGRGASWASPT